MNLLEKNLFQHCNEGKSGVVFITTDNNQACRIIIVDGVITATNMGLFKGLNALQQLKKLEIKDASFKNKMELPYKDEEKIESSDLALKILGYSSSPIKPEKLVDIAIPHKKEGIKKTVRMYRGQIVED